ncbi:hypothetical protein [Methylorubrum populi]|uniref:hypothetical protein n=1 Tax=Methylorubrum populi TaxID=223967 RepID=UPI000DB881B3|nr:hypothetical protein [Methylorubrum populi]PZP71764.1 MAG: hypothetical protein DI590_05750 [Methylorubrum populi]
MALERFNFPFHSPNDEYPGGSTIKFGRGYRFAAQPPGPDEIITHLAFPAMFVLNVNAGDAPHRTALPTFNIFALQDFYERHRMFKPFLYPHASRGEVIVRFDKPLIMPKAIKTSPGEVGAIQDQETGVVYRAHQVEPFELQMLIQP